MRIAEFLSEKNISYNLKARNKKETLEELVDLLVQSGVVRDKRKMLRALFEREALGSTGIGHGIAIPHSKSDAAAAPATALGIAKAGIPFGTLDGQPVYIVFLLVGPEDSANDHLRILSRISELLMDKNLRRRLLAAGSNRDVMALLEHHAGKNNAA